MAVKYVNVSEYLASVGEPGASTLRNVIDIVCSVDEALVEVVSWNVPQVKSPQGYVFGVAAFRNHLTLNPWSPAIISTFDARLSGYIRGSSTFRVPLDWTIDRSLIVDLVRARLVELDG